MTLEERWQAKYKEVMEFIKTNKKNPSKFVDSERGLRNWIKAARKRMNAGELKEYRVEMFNKLLELAEKYKHINQYQ